MIKEKKLNIQLNNNISYQLQNFSLFFFRLHDYKHILLFNFSFIFFLFVRKLFENK